MSNISIELLRQIFVCTDDGKIFFSDLCGKASGKRADKGYCGLYAKVKIFGVFDYAHRIIFAWHHGFYPAIVDHIDGNISNNCISNLRSVDPSQSVWNRQMPKNSTGYKGVHIEKQTGKYRAEIKVRGVRYRLGRFLTMEEAIRARQTAEEQYHGEFVRK